MDRIPATGPMENPTPNPPLAGLNPADLLRQGAAEDTMASAETFQPPTLDEMTALFPQFEILELIGKGGMGAVYKVRQKELDRIVALKILPPAIGRSPAFSDRFTREARALAKLNHPGIVTLHEFGQADGLYFILMEYVDGVNLGQLMRSGRISPREALAIVPQICDALQFAHDQGIVHRDIKPENILLDRLGRVKVADFGIAKLVDTASSFVVPPSGGSGDGLKVELPAFTEAGKVMGTPQYMAPEQIDHPADVDHRADIYALGVVFYQMLTGELPGKRLEAPSKKVQIDVRLDEIVLRAMEKDPELRYQHASVMKTMVENAGAANAAPVFPVGGNVSANTMSGGSGQMPPVLKNRSSSRMIGIGCGVIGLLAFVGFVLGIVFLFWTLRERELLAKKSQQAAVAQAEIRRAEMEQREGVENSADVANRYLEKPPQLQKATVEIFSDSELTLDDKAISLAALNDELSRMHHEVADLAVMIRSSPEVRYTKVVEVMEVCRKTGISRIEFAKDGRNTSGKMKINFDRAGDTMQKIVIRFRSDYGVRLCFENLDVKLKRDGKLADSPLDSNETERLRDACNFTYERKLGGIPMLDLGPRYEGRIVADSVEDFLNQVTQDTPFCWHPTERGKTWVIMPQEGSRLDFPVTLETDNLPVDEAVMRVTGQRPSGSLNYAQAAGLSVSAGIHDAVPWLSVKCKPQKFDRVPAWRVLCDITEGARPDSVWALYGYKEQRALVVPPGPSADYAVVSQAQVWLCALDSGGFLKTWEQSAEVLRARVTPDQRRQALEALRKPLGEPKFRKLKDATEVTSLPGAPDGRYLVMQFETVFASERRLSEIVTFQQEKDGVWRAVDYVIH